MARSKPPQEAKAPAAHPLLAPLPTTLVRNPVRFVQAWRHNGHDYAINATACVTDAEREQLEAAGAIAPKER